MIALLTGVVVERSAAQCVIDVGGVGYLVSMSTASLASLPGDGERVTVRTRLHVRDDGVALYGFITAEELRLFDRLITVSGVGPKVALAALSVLSPTVFARAVADDDVALVSSVPGIGKKTAQRIILELKDKLAETDMPAAGAATSVTAEAREALLSLGYSSAETADALKGYEGDAGDASALLRYALKRLGGAS